jgi:5'-3' exonuclease
VNMQWCFSRLLPPLWCDLVSYMEKGLYEEFTFPPSSPIQPSEQLAMVLPLESWHFIEDASLRCLPLDCPQFWPSSFQFFSAGRIHMWECEALLPILPVERIRSAVKQRLDRVASK